MVTLFILFLAAVSIFAILRSKTASDNTGDHWFAFTKNHPYFSIAVIIIIAVYCIVVFSSVNL